MSQDLATRFSEYAGESLPKYAGTFGGVLLPNDRLCWLSETDGYRVSVLSELSKVCETEAETSEQRDAELLASSVSLEDFFNTEVGHVGAES